MSSCSRACLLFLSLLHTGACSDGERAVAIEFRVRVGAEPLACGATYANLGTTQSTWEALEAKLFIHDPRLVRSDAELHAEHKAALATLGQRVRVELHAGESVVGVAEDLDGAGRLLVRSDDMQLHEIGVGDVVHLRAQ